MVDGDLRRIEEIFAEAVALPPAQRAAFLDERCAGDDQLRAEVARLLRADAFDDEMTFDVSRCAYELTVGAAGEVIGGRYELAEFLGEGGSGVVWRALQERPLRRVVALKLLKAGSVSRLAAQQFDLEARVLSAMQHPGVARIFDAGIDPVHGPYLVTELIQGEPIIDACDAARVGLRERLCLFIDVCDAVQHAHEKGVIHRDLKPANILTSFADRRPFVKVIDFGVAQATAWFGGPPRTDALKSPTAGTPGYMAPEQITSGAGAMDSRFDIFALGMVLRELVTSRRHGGASSTAPPPSSGSGASAGPSGAQRGARTESRASTAREVSSALRLGLQWIIAKATAENREDRYASASELARDVERFLEGRALEAGPSTGWYEARVFARRHRIPLAVAFIVSMVLLVGLVVTFSGLRRATESEARAAAISYTLALSAAAALLEVDQAQCVATLERFPESERGWAWWAVRNLAEPRYRRLPGRALPMIGGTTAVPLRLEDGRWVEWDMDSWSVVRELDIGEPLHERMRFARSDDVLVVYEAGDAAEGSLSRIRGFDLERAVWLWEWPGADMSATRCIHGRRDRVLLIDRPGGEVVEADLRTGEAISRWPAPERSLTTAMYATDGRTILWYSIGRAAGGTITQAEGAVVRASLPVGLQGAGMAADDLLLYAPRGTRDGFTLHQFNMLTGERHAELWPMRESLRVQLIPSGHVVATDVAGTVRVYDSATRLEEGWLRTAPRSATISAVGQWLIFDREMAWKWDEVAMHPAATRTLDRWHRTGVGVSSDGAWLASGSWQMLHMFRTRTGELRWSRPVSSSQLHVVAVSQGGRYVAARGLNGSVVVVDGEDGEVLSERLSLERKSLPLVWVDDVLAVADGDAVRLLMPGASEWARSLGGGGRVVLLAAAGARLIVVTEDSSGAHALEVWDDPVRSEQPWRRIELAGVAHSLALSPDGARAAVALDGVVEVHGLVDQSVVDIEQPGAAVRGFLRSDGSLVCTWRGRLAIFDRTGLELVRIPGVAAATWAFVGCGDSLLLPDVDAEFVRIEGGPVQPEDATARERERAVRAVVDPLFAELTFQDRVEAALRARDDLDEALRADLLAHAARRETFVAGAWSSTIVTVRAVGHPSASYERVLATVREFERRGLRSQESLAAIEGLTLFRLDRLEEAVSVLDAAARRTAVEDWSALMMSVQALVRSTRMTPEAARGALQDARETLTAMQAAGSVVSSLEWMLLTEGDLLLDQRAAASGE